MYVCVCKERSSREVYKDKRDEMSVNDFLVFVPPNVLRPPAPKKVELRHFIERLFVSQKVSQ